MADPGKEAYPQLPPPYGQPPPGQPLPGQVYPGPAYPQQPGYGGGNVTVITQAPQAKPSDYLGLAIFTTICCNVIFGVIAIVFSVMSSSTADDGDLEGAKTKGKISMGLSIAGILVTVLSVVIVILYFTVFAVKVVDSLNSLNE